MCIDCAVFLCFGHARLHSSTPGSVIRDCFWKYSEGYMSCQGLNQGQLPAKQACKTGNRLPVPLFWP